MRNLLLIRYGEVALRKKNRGLFINQLIDAIRCNLKGDGYYVIKEQGRLILENKNHELDMAYCLEKVQKVLGLVELCPCKQSENKDMDSIQNMAVTYLKEHFGEGLSCSFKVVTKRADKKYPYVSNEISAMVGDAVLQAYPEMKVDVKNPELTLRVEIRNDVYIYAEGVKGLGGLPAGATGKGVALLSGGIDSPVALFMMAKRGVTSRAVYFHSPPYTSERAKQKVKDLAARLSLYTGSFVLDIVPFTDVQLYLLEHVPEDKLTVFLKRAMVKAANKIADATGALCLITGDSVGQVASQTLSAIHAIDTAADLPILRPLSGMDKQEIIDKAIMLGTYDISIRPYEDCCTIFVAKHPEIRPKRSVIESMEAKLTALEDEIQKAVDGRESIEIEPE